MKKTHEGLNRSYFNPTDNLRYNYTTPIASRTEEVIRNFLHHFEPMFQGQKEASSCSEQGGFA